MKSQIRNGKKIRCTIMLDDEVAVRLRKLQSDMIRKSSSTVSFSRIINEILRKGI